MKRDIERHEAILETLRRLEQYPTLSPFCRLFYRFIYDLSGEPQVETQKLEQAFHLFLRCEIRRHAAVTRIMNAGKLDLLQIVRAGRDAHRILERLRACLERMELAGRQEQMIRELILTETNYHLGRTEEVVRSLRRAIALGSAHALVHFALGYNLYVLAMQRFTQPGARKGQVIAREPAQFEKAIREAITAFEGGLGGQGYDAQIYWWVGILWEILGERPEARAAFKNAMQADPENFTTQTIEKLRGMDDSTPIQRSAREVERLARLEPISEEEIREARAFLEGCESPFADENG